jgi:hypothetical protein
MALTGSGSGRCRRPDRLTLKVSEQPFEFRHCLVGPGVVHDGIAGVPLSLQRPLTRFATGQFGFCPTPIPGDPLLSVGQSALDENDVVADGSPSRLQQQRCVDHDRLQIGSGLVFVNLPSDFLGDLGMRDGFQALPAGLGFGIVAKDQRTETRPVDFTIPREYPIAEVLAHLRLHPGAFQNLMADRIRCNHGNFPPGRQGGSHKTLA